MLNYINATFLPDGMAIAQWGLKLTVLLDASQFKKKKGQTHEKSSDLR
jgi:hypothetical protein